jgi:ribonucleoside-triphosphate reductase
MLDNIVQFNGDKNTRGMMADAKFFEGYSRWNDEKNRYETWDEAVNRVMNMHRKFYSDKMTDKLSALIDEVEESYRKKEVLGAQRALQFGGDQLIKHQMRLYNCTSTYADRASFFGEYFYTLLCGAGVGVSVSRTHTQKLPKLRVRNKQSKVYEIDDSIEGWGSSADVLMSSYFEGGGVHPDYEGRKVLFDTSKIRKKGSHISGGFKAPGPEPLRLALDKIERMLHELVTNGVTELRPIHIYDIAMFLADAVLAGGVRRSATIFLFDIEDEEMMNAKTGNWFIDNPQRARSNNSAIILKNKTTKEQFDKLFASTKQFGEPGFVFLDNEYIVYNPCVEIGMVPNFNGITGFQGCNLTEINGGLCTSKEHFHKVCRISAILGTLQAGYTNFKFLSEESKKIFEREALLGVSLTGWMNNPDVLFNEEILKEGAQIVKDVNEEVAEMIGINPAARTTCSKPAGNASVLLETASGIGGEHSEYYIRNVQMNKETEVARLLKETNPYMVEESIWSATNSDYVISFPVIAPKQSIFKKDLDGISMLEKVKFVQKFWVESGTRIERCVDKNVRHNVSNTVIVHENEWEKVRDYLFENRETFAGVSLLSNTGDYDFNQAPMTSVMMEDEIVAKFGRGAMFASGLIVDSTTGFPNLWSACAIAQMEEDIGDRELADIRSEWIRRFKKYTENYFRGDVKRAEYCLKAVHLLHRWEKIQQNLHQVDFAVDLTEKSYTDIDTMGSAACVGGACEV